MDPLVQKIVREGVGSLKTDMLPPEMRLNLFTKAGDKLLHANKLPEAAHTYALAGNIQKLRETGAWFLEQNRQAEAAMFLKHVGSPEELHRLAENCIANNHMSAAKEIYSELGDEAMVMFLDENFSKEK